ncbi:uncharacterized protein LOC131956655 [Physella acuta]|uniref:uncharacterized protein LOC131956655 n=1 Tax=Physella acuta TaxID=109671 RepID=UPI0027DBBCE9|nr:uncharacterized protein LOC131956655 [Physella acuta]
MDRPLSLTDVSSPEPTPALNDKDSTNSSRPPRTSKRLSDVELQRFLRRIQRPTISHQLSCKDNLSSDSTTTITDKGSVSAASVDSTDRQKAFNQLSRPTTASRAKNVAECYLCDEAERESNKTLVPFVYPYADDKALSREEVAKITSRVSTPTNASERGLATCVRAPINYDSVRALSKDLPLICGLHRSKSVHHIVNRLHFNPRPKRHHCHTTRATPINF